MISKSSFYYGYNLTPVKRLPKKVTPCVYSNIKDGIHFFRCGLYYVFSSDWERECLGESFPEILIPCDPIDAVRLIPLYSQVDNVEPYGTYKDITEKDISELTDWLTVTEENYGIKPIIYTTSKWYNKQIKDSFPDYDIWIRSVYSTPNREVKWTFWQYSNRMCLDGYDGEEKYIDMNVFDGSTEEFLGYPKVQ